MRERIKPQRGTSVLRFLRLARTPKLDCGGDFPLFYQREIGIFPNFAGINVNIKMACSINTAAALN